MVACRAIPILLASYVILCGRIIAQESVIPSFAFSRGELKGDLRRVKPLDRVITVDFRDVTIDVALQHVGDAAHVLIKMDSSDAILMKSRVSVRARWVTVKEVVERILDGTGRHVVASSDADLVVVSDTRVAQRSPSATGAITGVARDAENGDRLVGVLVSLGGTTFHVLTDAGGQYALKAIPKGQYILVTRRLGYHPLSKVVQVDTGSVTINLELARSHALLDEVVTTATGDAYAREVGYTVGSIQADSIVAKTGTNQLSDVISGRVPGAQVFSTGGEVGVSPQINIRGQNSVNLTDQPLLYIDGVRVANDIGQANSGVSGRFNDVLPEEVESVELIKGPAASALYGTDAANGIIVVHTKRGRLGRRQWALYAQTGTSSVDKSLFADNYMGWGHTLSGTRSTVACALWQVAEHFCAQDSIQHFSPLKDPYTTPFGTGGINELGAQVSGGGDTRYFLSGAYAEQSGYQQLPKSDLSVLAAERGGAGIGPSDLHPNGLVKESFRANIVTSLAPTASLSVSGGYVTQDDQIPNEDVTHFGYGGAAFRDTSGGWAYSERPLYLYALHQAEQVHHFTFGANPSWRPVKWLVVQGGAGVDASDLYTNQLTPAGETTYPPEGQRTDNRAGVTMYSGTMTAVASSPASLLLTSSTAIGANYNRDIDHQVAAYQGTLGPGCTTLNCGTAPYVSELNSDQVTAGAFAEQTLGIGDQLFMKLGGRVDGGSTFGNAYQTAFYPRASVSWLASSAPFISHLPGLSLLRLRAAYGQAGVQPSPTTRYSIESSTAVYVDGGVTQGVGIGQIGNANIRPERQSEVEGGVDADWFGGRVHIEWTYYSKRSSDALANEQLATSLGGYSQQINIGEVANLGYEALISVKPIDGRFFSWDVTVNASVNHNKLVRFAPGLTCATPVYAPTSCAGYPLFSYFEFPLNYADRNGDRIIDTNEVTIGSAQQFSGQTYPKTQLTMQHTISLFQKRLQLSGVVDYRGNFVALEPLFQQGQAARALYVAGSSLSDQAAALANEQGALSGYVVDASFVKLRNVAATLALPDLISRAVHLRSTSVTISAMNLFLWTKFKGGDPESNGVMASNFGAYYPTGSLPMPRTWVVRMNLGL
jgi:TonB-linked SusC/RagA family outer membrane protein